MQNFSLLVLTDKITLLFCYTHFEMLTLGFRSRPTGDGNSLSSTALYTSPEASANFLLAPKLLPFFWKGNFHPRGKLSTFSAMEALGRPPGLTLTGLAFKLGTLS